jgi:DNA-binding transcriptional ArsR family regulator
MDNNTRLAATGILKAMAHPLRLGIIELLADDNMTVTELCDRLDCSQSMMSQQLKILQAQKLVFARRNGNNKEFSLCNRDFLKLFGCMQKHLLKFFKL